MLYSIKFRLRSQNHNPQTNLTPIYCRISLNGTHCSDFFTGVRCNPKRWNQKAQLITGYSKEIQEDNSSLENIRANLKAIINNLKDGENVHTVRDKYLLKDVPPPSLIEAFKIYIKNEKECYNNTPNQLSPKTIEKWYYSLNHLQNFIGEKFTLSSVKKGFDSNYFKFLLSTGKMSNNHAVRNVSYLRSVLDYCVIEKWIEDNPILLKGIKRDKPKPIVYLKPNEVEFIERMDRTGSLRESIDVFLFSCYTTLDNNEIKKLDASKHIQDNCILIHRGKTKNKSLQIIPILPKAKLLLEKYKYRLPVVETYTINRQLDFIEKTLGLNYNLTTKIGRKTAGMFFLTNRVPLEIVSRILGHKSIVTTQKHYADILDKDLVINSTKHLM